MTGKQLKNSILQWAIQGKLVPQNPNDEPASVLLEKIRAEKDRLIKEGKIKKDKKVSIIYRGEDNSYYEKFADGRVFCIDEEIPFEIPQGWEWTRLKRIIQLLSGRDLEPSQYNSEGVGVPYMTGASNFVNGKLIINRWTKEPVTLSHVGDLLITCKGTIGTMAFNNVGDIHIARQIMGISSSHANLQYIWLFLEIYVVELQKAARSIIPGISRDDMLSAIIPLPPINEQKRIVDKITSLSSFIDKFSVNQELQDMLNSNIKSLLRKSILQEAIQGRLVPQNPADDPASTLLQRIKEEKLRLVKDGKLKKKDIIESVIFKGDDNKYYEKIGKENKEITEEIPFEIPTSWEWIRGKTAFHQMESTKPKGKSFLYVDVDAVNNVQNVIDKAKTIATSKAPSRATRKLHTGDVLFSMVRPYLRNIALVKDEYAEAIASTGFYVIRPTCALFSPYLFYLMLSSYVVDGLNQHMKGDNSPSINNGHIENYLYPLPPINEQKRIVSMIEKILDRIKG